MNSSWISWYCRGSTLFISVTLHVSTRSWTSVLSIKSCDFFECDRETLLSQLRSILSTLIDCWCNLLLTSKCITCVCFSIDLHTSLTQSLLELDHSSVSAISQCHPATSTVPIPLQPLGSSGVSPLNDQSALTPAPTVIGVPMTSLQHQGIPVPPLEGCVGAGLTQLVNQSTTMLQFDPVNFATQPMLPIVQFDSGLPTPAFVDTRNDFAPKIKGSFTLASFAKAGSKFAPY